MHYSADHAKTKINNSFTWCNTLIFEVAGADAIRYLSLIALSLAMTLGKTEAKPGIKLSIHINSFSIQLRSWLLQTEIMKIVCREQKRNQTKGQ